MDRIKVIEMESFGFCMEVRINQTIKEIELAGGFIEDIKYFASRDGWLKTAVIEYCSEE